MPDTPTLPALTIEEKLDSSFSFIIQSYSIGNDGRSGISVFQSSLCAWILVDISILLMHNNYYEYK